MTIDTDNHSSSLCNIDNLDILESPKTESRQWLRRFKGLLTKPVARNAVQIAIGAHRQQALMVKDSINRLNPHHVEGFSFYAGADHRREDFRSKFIENICY